MTSGIWFEYRFFIIFFLVRTPSIVDRLSGCLLWIGTRAISDVSRLAWCQSSWELSRYSMLPRQKQQFLNSRKKQTHKIPQFSPISCLTAMASDLEIRIWPIQSHVFHPFTAKHWQPSLAVSRQSVANPLILQKQVVRACTTDMEWIHSAICR
jgi:hypothetical protein